MTKMIKKIKRIELRTYLFILGIILLFTISIQIENIENKITKIPYNKHNYTTANFINNIETINKNCDSVFITKQYNKKGWFVFTNKCINDYCKVTYIKLEDCLK